jgi:undecaprenyl-diphosphatase
VKFWVRRRRPPSQRGEKNYLEAFPSGHTTPVTAITLTAAYVAARERLAPASRLAPAALATAAVVGATRVYLDQHWATDVAGGWALGGIVAALCGAYYDARERRAPRVRRPRRRA